MIRVYKLWHEFFKHFDKTAKYTLGEKIDGMFVEITELVFVAIHSEKDKKVIYLQKANTTLDILKFFIQLAWEIKMIDTKKYVLLSEHLNEIGRMLGGWIKQCLMQPPQKDKTEPLAEGSKTPVLVPVILKPIEVQVAFRIVPVQTHAVTVPVRVLLNVCNTIPLTTPWKPWS